MSRFAIANGQDQSAALWIMAILLLVYTTVTTLVRGFVKFNMAGPDDGAAGIVQLLTYGNAFSVIYALRHGLAKRAKSQVSTGKEIRYEQALQASIMLYILALAAAKVTTVLFVGRIFRGAGNAHAQRLCIVGVVLMIVWGVGAVLTVSVNCDLERLWSTGKTATCDGDTRWLVVSILDGVTELAILMLAIGLVSRLQMTMKKKLTVCSAFAWRLGLVFLTAFHYRSHHLLHLTQTDGVNISKPVIWEQVSICYSVLSITWPFSKAFVNGFDTAPLAAVSAYGSGSAAHESAMAKARSRTGSEGPGNKHSWRNDGLLSKATCSHYKDSTRTNGSFGSEEMIIRRDYEFTVSSFPKRETDER